MKYLPIKKNCIYLSETSADGDDGAPVGGGWGGGVAGHRQQGPANQLGRARRLEVRVIGRASLQYRSTINHLDGGKLGTLDWFI